MLSGEIALKNNHYYYYYYIMLAYLMLFAALSNAVCLYNTFFCHRFSEMLSVFTLCLGLLTHSLFISCMTGIIIIFIIKLHHAQCIQGQRLSGPVC